MKAINWTVMLGLVINVIAQLMPDFPAEAATLVVVNGVILIAYIYHKVKG